jgi:hypothetical protein
MRIEAENPRSPKDIVLKTEEQAIIIKIFAAARDLSFDCGKTVEKPNSVEETISVLQRLKRGSCSAKHYLLGEQIESLGIEVSYLTFPFNWADLEIDYPNDLKTLLPKLPLQFHLCLGVNLGNQSCLLDATWDQALGKHGFRVNEMDFLPCHQTLGVVPTEKPIVSQTAEERWNYILSLKKTMARNEAVQPFYEGLNSWLQSLRD